MFEIIEKSVKHFFEEILKCKLKPTRCIRGELYGSSIPLTSKAEGEFDFYLFFPKGVFERYRDIFLKGAELKEDDWCDLSREFANQIIGFAKIKLNEDTNEFKLGIPEYLGRVEFADFRLDKKATYSVGEFAFRIGYKKR